MYDELRNLAAFKLAQEKAGADTVGAYDDLTNCGIAGDLLTALTLTEPPRPRRKQTFCQRPSKVLKMLKRQS